MQADRDPIQHQQRLDDLNQIGRVFGLLKQTRWRLQLFLIRAGNVSQHVVAQAHRADGPASGRDAVCACARVRWPKLLKLSRLSPSFQADVVAGRQAVFCLTEASGEFFRIHILTAGCATLSRAAAVMSGRPSEGGAPLRAQRRGC